MISQTAEYALRATVCLASRSGSPQTTQQIAPEQQQEAQKADTAQLTQDFTPAGAGMTEASYASANPGAPKEIGESMAASLASALNKGKAYAKTTAAMSALNRGGLRTNIAPIDRPSMIIMKLFVMANAAITPSNEKLASSTSR